MTEHVLATMNERISYGFSSEHMALDLVPENGGDTDAIAFAEGTVEVAVSNVKYTNHSSKGNATYGNYVIIKHPNGYKTLYAHLKYESILVNAGDYVSKGQRLATIGQTGNAYGVHLHFEIRGPDNKLVNPNDYLFRNNTAFSPNESTENSSLENTNKNTTVSENNNNTNTSNIKTDATNEDKQAFKDKMDNTKGNIEGNSNNPIDANETVNFSNEITDNNETVKVNNDDYLKNTSYTGGSIVDGLKGLSEDSSFDHRAILALANGIDNYVGSFSQNVFLLKLLKTGELVRA